MYIHLHAIGYALIPSSIGKFWEVNLCEYSGWEQNMDWFPSEDDVKHTKQDKLLHENAEKREYITF